MFVNVKGPEEPSPPSIENKICQIVAWSSLAVLIVSIVATAILFSLSQTHILNKISPLILYCPPAGTAALAMIVGLIALACQCCKKKPEAELDEETAHQDQPSTPDKNDASLESSDSASDPIESAYTQSLDTSQTSSASKEQNPLSPFAFSEPVLEPLDRAQRTTCFALFMGDFMGLDLKKSGPNSVLSLSFLIKGLELLKQHNYVDRKKLELLIHRFEIAHRFASFQHQLQKALKIEEYQNGRAELKKRIIETLKQEEYLLLNCGYNAESGGHTTLLKLLLKDGLVHAEFLNFGEGSEFHDTIEDEKIKAHSLHLQTIPLQKLENATFLDHLIDLQMTHILPSERAYQVSEKTHYKIFDVYNVLLSLWPEQGPLQPNYQSVHTLQYGDSCSIKSFRAVLKEELGEDAEQALLFLGDFAFSHLDISSLDLNRIRDALAQWNRKTVQLDRKKRLHPRLKNTILTTSQKVLGEIEAQEYEREKELRQRCLSQWNLDYDSYQMEVTKITENSRKSTAVAHSSFTFPDLSCFIDFVKTVHKEIDSLTQNGQWQIAQSLAKQAILKLPNPSDAFWATKRSTDEIKKIASWAQVFLKEPVSETKALSFTTNTALLYLKVLTILLMQASKKGINDKAIQYYGSQVKKILEQAAPFYAITHPEYAKIYRECSNYLSKFTDIHSEIKLKKIGFWEVETPEYNSLTKMREDEELKFLNDYLNTHPELYDSRYPEGPKKALSEEKNTFALFVNEGGLNFSFDESQHESLSHLTLLRELQYGFMYTSYLTGNIQGPQDFGIINRFESSEDHAGNLQKTIKMPYFTPKNVQNLKEGLFLDTFHNFSDAFKQLLTELLDTSSTFMGLARTNQNQQLLIQNDFHDGKISLNASELQELLAIKTYGVLMIPQLIAYFKQHFFRLKDPAFQALFSHFLFSLDNRHQEPILSDVFASSHFVKHQLMEFLRDAVQETEKIGWVESHFFLLRTWLMVCRYLVESKSDNALLESTLKEIRRQFKKLMEKKGAFEEMACYTLVSCLPYLDHSTMQHHLKKFEALLNNHSVIRCHFQTGQSRQLQEDMIFGKNLCQKKQATTLLPEMIVAHKDYFFKHTYSVTRFFNDRYEFYDEHGDHYAIAYDQNLHIYKEMDGRWYKQTQHTFVKPSTTSDTPLEPGKGFFSINVRNWTSLGDPAVVLGYSVESGKLLYRATPEGIFHPTSKDPLRLTTSKNQLGFARIASPHNILAWKNQNHEIVLIEIPNLAIHFELKNGKWWSSNHSGYYLDVNPDCSELDLYSHYLTLRNHKGQRIVLAINYGIAPKRQKSLKHMPIHYELYTIKPSLFVYRLSNQGKIKPPEDPHALIYLIYLALRKADYVAARKWIQLLKREKPELKKEWCLWITLLESTEQSTRDIHPDAQILRIQLRLFMLDQLSEQQKMGLSTDYFSFLKQRTHRFDAKLSKKEELTCIALLEKLNLLPRLTNQLMIRKALLKGEPLPAYTLARTTFKENPAVISTHFTWLNYDPIVKNMLKHKDAPKPIVNPSRPGSSFIDNFLYYYTIARHSSQSSSPRQELMELLRVSRGLGDIKILECCRFLYDVVKQPDRYPTIDSLLSDEKKIASTLAELAERWPLRDDYVGCGIETLKPFASHSNIPQRRSFAATEAKIKPPVKLEKWVTSFGSLPTLWERKGIYIRQTEEAREAILQKDLDVLDEMEAFFLSCKEDNPCVQKEFHRLIEGIIEKKKRIKEELASQKASYLLDLTKIDALETHLQELRAVYTDEMSDMKKNKIFKIAHAYEDELLLEKLGGMLKPLSLKELILYFGTDNDEAIYQSNPSITPFALKQLKKNIGEYLLTATELQKIDRLSKELKKIKRYQDLKGADSPETKSAMASLITLAAQERVYEPGENNHLLVFEYIGKIRLRKEQLTALEATAGSNQNIELEARTGFGKSSVLIPLWLYLKSCKNKAAMMALPASLFSAQKKHLKKILGKAFDASIIPLEFDRAKANDPAYLKKIRQHLRDAGNKGKKGRKILLTTVQSLHGMTHLKIKEAFLFSGGKAQEARQEELLALRNGIASQVACFFDESKECFNIRQRYDYAVGEATQLDKKQIKNVCALYRELLLESGLAKEFQFEFMPPSKKAKTLPIQENYEKELLPRCAALLVKKFGLSGDLEKLALADLQGVHSQACEDDLYPYLSGQGLLEKYDHDKKQLTLHLRRTLFKKCEDSYGFYPSSRLAIPFIDGVPKLTSEFTEIEDSLNATLQANLKKPFTKADVMAFVDQLKLKSLKKSSQDFDKTAKVQWMTALYPKVPIMQLSDTHCQEIADHLNEKKNIKDKLCFIEYAILPQIKFHKQKICSTPFHLANTIEHIQAASGVVSPETLPPRLKTQEDKTAVIDNLMALWKQPHNHLLPLKKNNLLKQMLSHFTEENVLIDVAGFFRGQSMVEMSEAILALRPNVKGVLLYDDAGEEYVYERDTKQLLPREASLLETEDLFIYLRKSKVIGTNVEGMLVTAKAIVTVDRDTSQDLFFQGSGRMRKLAESQKASFAFLEDDSDVLFPEKQQLFNYLVKYVVIKSGKQKGEDVFRTLRLYLEAQTEALFWQTTKKHATIAQSQTLFNHLKQFLVIDSQSKPMAHLNKGRSKLPIKEAVAQLKNETLKPIKLFLQHNLTWKSVFDLDQLETAFDAFVDYSKLPLEIDMHDGEDGICDAIHDNEDATDRENDHENITHKERVPNVVFTPMTPMQSINYRIIFDQYPSEHLLGIPIFYGLSFARVSYDPTENAKVQKRANQYLIKKEKNGNLSVALLDLHDAFPIILALHPTLQDSTKEKNNSYFLFSGDRVIAQSDSNAPPLSPEELLPISLIAKLFTANSDITTQEKQFLQKNGDTKEFVKFSKNLQNIWPHLMPFTTKCESCIT